MNPFLFKAHPLLYATISLLIGAGSPGLPEMAGVLGIYLAINLPLAMLLAYRVRRLAHIRLRLRAAYPLALPATVLYTPIALTLLDDVVRRAFHLEDRFLLLFALVVATALLAALFGVALHDRNGEPLGSEGGLMLALTMLLACVPYGLVLLALDRLFNIFPVT